MASVQLNSDHMRAFDRLKEVAAHGEPCPSNREMGEWLGFSPGWAQTMLEILNRNGLIRVFARKSIRKIMIVSTGAVTAPNSKRVNDDLPEIQYKVVTNYGGAPTVRYDPADLSTIPPGAQLVDRDPCPFCAVRGDIGCEHSRRRAA